MVNWDMLATLAPADMSMGAEMVFAVYCAESKREPTEMLEAVCLPRMMRG